MATSNFTITITLTNATQVNADAKRDAALVDYCKAYNLDIYTDSTRTVIDQAKAVAAIRAHIRQHLVNVVVGYRATQAGEAARVQKAADEAAALA